MAWTDAAVKDGQICVGKRKKIGGRRKLARRRQVGRVMVTMIMSSRIITEA